MKQTAEQQPVERRGQRARAGREVAHGADEHRAEQDSRARLSPRRDHGPADVRRNHLPAADGRVSDAGHRPPDGSDAGVVHRSRRDAAVDAGGAQHGDDRRAAARLRGRGRARIRPLSWRRHRELHAVSGQRAGARAQGRVVPGRGGRDRRSVAGNRRRDSGLRPPLPHAGPARGAPVSDGAGARSGRRAHLR